MNIDASGFGFTAPVAEALGSPRVAALHSRKPDWIGGSISAYDQRFLVGMLRLLEPRSIVEVGVASGWGAVVILDTMDSLGYPYEYVGIDLSREYYLDKDKPTGAAVPAVLPDHPAIGKMLLGATAAGAWNLIDHSLDFAFIDANHLHPWAILDFLAVLPRLEPGAAVVLHDLSLSTFERHMHKNRGPKYLFEGWPLHKLHSTQKPTMIGALKLPESQSLDDLLLTSLLDILYCPWETRIPEDTLEGVALAVKEKSGSDEWTTRFKKAFAELNR